MISFCGMEIFGYCLDHHKIGLYLGVNSMHFLFLRSRHRMVVFLGLLKFQIFFGSA